MVKIYDCFTFFNELDLLEIRLSEMDNYVDYFVIVEARQTHSGKKKKLYFEENKKRFEEWSDKIIHIIVDLPEFNFIDKILMYLERTKYFKYPRMVTSNLGFGRWKLERKQREFIKKGLNNAKDEDIIMVSDVDEIPRPEKIKKMVNILKEYHFGIFRQRKYYYFLNGYTNQPWIGTKACKFKTLKKCLNGNPQYLRIPSVSEKVKNKLNIKTRKTYAIKDGGWHFSYLGGIKKVKEKIESFAHIELSEDLDNKDIQKDLEDGKFIYRDRIVNIKYSKIDKSFPKIIFKNQTKWKKLIK